MINTYKFDFDKVTTINHIKIILQSLNIQFNDEFIDLHPSIKPLITKITPNEEI